MVLVWSHSTYNVALLANDTLFKVNHAFAVTDLQNVSISTD